MFIEIERVKIFIKPGVTDMRKAINGLSAIVQDEMELNLFTDSVFIFCSKNRKTLKIIYWHKNGFCLWQKRLEKEKFPWPKNELVSREITLEQLNWLLSGIDFFQAHQSLEFSEI